MKSKVLSFAKLAVCLSAFSSSALADPRPTTPEPMSQKTALQFFTDNNIQIGWNLGNTLDAVSGGQATETAWGNPLASQNLLNGVNQSGFDIVRIPCTWIGHIGPAPDYRIDEARLLRVAEVIDYAKTAGAKAMIINIHHDGNYTSPPTWGFLDFAGAVNNPAKKDEIQDQLAKVWAQIAEYFKNYGDYLIFETLNEIHNGNWGFGNHNDANYQHQQNILFDWNQAALSAIRATGGNNATRFVAVPGLGSTEPETVIAAHSRQKLLPNDPGNGTDKLIVSVHYYHPAGYTVADAENRDFPLVHTWGSPSERIHPGNAMRSLKTTFIDNGIAVYVGEWGAPTNLRRNMSEAIKNTHVDYIRTVAAAAVGNRVIPIYWDDGGNFKMLERSNGRPNTGIWADVLTAMMDAKSADPDSIITGQWGWETFTDSDNNGTSTINMSEEAGVITITGNVTNVFEHGYVGWQAVPTDAATLADLRAATSISFKVVGDGKTYRIILPTSDITDYCYYVATFPTTNGVETTVTVDINTFTQPDWGIQKPFDRSLIRQIQWQTAEGALGTFNLSIKDLVLIGEGTASINKKTSARSFNSASVAITNRRLNLSFPAAVNSADITIHDLRGRLLFERNVAVSGNFASVALPKSITKNQAVILQVKANSGFNMTRRFFIN